MEIDLPTNQRKMKTSATHQRKRTIQNRSLLGLRKQSHAVVDSGNRKRFLSSNSELFTAKFSKQPASSANSQKFSRSVKRLRENDDSADNEALKFLRPDPANDVSDDEEIRAALAQPLNESRDGFDSEDELPADDVASLSLKRKLMAFNQPRKRKASRGQKRKFSNDFKRRVKKERTKGIKRTRRQDSGPAAKQQRRTHLTDNSHQIGLGLLRLPY